MSRGPLVRLEQATGYPLAVSAEFVVGVWEQDVPGRGARLVADVPRQPVILLAGLSPMPLKGTFEDVSAAIDAALNAED